MQMDAEPNHGPRPPYPSDQTMLDALYSHVTSTPDAIALVAPEGDVGHPLRLEISYAEMWSIVSRGAAAFTAARLRGSSGWVILVLPQGLQQIIAVWSVLLSGCGYVPIDADTQAARLRMLFEETDPCLAIGEAGEPPLHEVAREFGRPFGCFPDGLHSTDAHAGLVCDAVHASLQAPRPRTRLCAAQVRGASGRALPATPLSGNLQNHEAFLGVVFRLVP